MTPTLEEKLDKIRSPNLQNQQQSVSVLEGIESTLRAQNTPATPTAYFAALLSLLLLDNKNLAVPVVYLLDVVTPFTPEPLLRAKFTQILSLLAPVLSQPDADAPLIRPSIGVLKHLLLAQDSAAWDMSAAQLGPRRAVGGLLSLALDHRPKVRKRALDALQHILRRPPPSPSLDHPAAPMCAETAMHSLLGLTDKTTASRSNKENRSNGAGKAGAAHDPELIHALQLVKAVASASGGWPAKKIEPLCELLLGIARSGNEHMSTAVFDVFEMIFKGMAAHDAAAASKMPRLLEIIQQLRPSSNDTQLLPPWIAILSRAYDVSAQMAPEETFQELVGPFRLVSTYLESQARSIRISASECLVSFMANCVPRKVILEPSIHDEKVLKQLVEVVQGLLTVQYQAAWMETFSVIGSMFDALRWRAAPHLLDLARTVSEMRGNDSFTGKQEADMVLGKAIGAMGPEAVLSIVPLNLAKPVKGQPGRAWMLPLLRDYTANTHLSHFRKELVPLSEVMFQHVLDHGSAERTMEIKIYETVVHQVWSIFPSYCELPLDMREALDKPFAEMLTILLYEQVDLRLDICRGLKALVESNQALASLGEDDEVLFHSRTSSEDGRKNLEYLGTNFAADFLAVLFNVYSTTLAHKRAAILQTIDVFLSITPAERLVQTFALVCQMLQKALQESTGKPKAQKQDGADQAPSESHTLMDLIVTMSIYLPRESFKTLFEVAARVIGRNDDPQIQKKAYKLIPRLAESPAGKAALEARHSELQQLLLANAESVSAAARRERLVAMAALIPFLPDASLHFIPAILSEVVIGCKEHNEKARNAAFIVLVSMGHKMDEKKGTPIDNSKVPHMSKDAPPATASIEEYVTMVSAGLAGATPHMISASIIAISMILYDFRNVLSQAVMADLVQTMDLFLTSKNREIVKSVLGFVKVCVVSLPVELMQPRLPTLVPSLMVWSNEHKGHFRAKVKHILERMIRRFGFDLVNKHCPESDRKVLTNIRKTKERNKRRKEAAVHGDDADEPADRKGRFESEYDQALYSSDESDGAQSDAESDDDAPHAKSRKGGKKGAGNAYIIEDGDEPLDLLDRNALANISSTKPTKLKKQTPKSKGAKRDLDGKLILGENDAAMEIDTAGDGGVANGSGRGQDAEESGVGAYVAALRGKDAPTRGMRGKLKFSTRRKGRDDDDDDETEGENGAGMDKMDVDGGAGAGGKAEGAGGGGRPGSSKRGGFQTKRGGRGGRGGIAAGRRGLGAEKQRGPAMNGRIGKRGGGGGGGRGRR